MAEIHFWSLYLRVFSIWSLCFKSIQLSPCVFKPLSILPLESTPLEIAYVASGNCWHDHLKIIKNKLIQPHHYFYYFFTFLFFFLSLFYFYFFLFSLLSSVLLPPQVFFLPFLNLHSFNFSNTYSTSLNQIPQFLANQTRSQQNIWKPNTT